MGWNIFRYSNFAYGKVVLKDTLASNFAHGKVVLKYTLVLRGSWLCLWGLGSKKVHGRIHFRAAATVAAFGVQSYTMVMLRILLGKVTCYIRNSQVVDRVRNSQLVYRRCLRPLRFLLWGFDGFRCNWRMYARSSDPSHITIDLLICHSRIDQSWGCGPFFLVLRLL